MKRLFGIVLLLAMLLSVAACSSPAEELPSEGTDDSRIKPAADASVYSGTPDTSWYSAEKKEFTLTSADQFAGMGILQEGGADFDGMTVTLARDMIFNSGNAADYGKNPPANEWTFTGTSTPFKGTFDGGSHVISGVWIKCGNFGGRALFGSASGNAVIRDLSVVNSYFAVPPIENKSIGGGILARVAEPGAKVTVSGIYCEYTVEESGAPFSTFGGIIGNIAENTEVSVSDCSFHGRVALTGTEVGGIVGKISGKNSKVVLRNCENHASLSASQKCGGLIGSNATGDLDLTGSQNKGSLSCPFYVDASVGFTAGAQTLINGDDCSPIAPAGDGYASLRVMSFNIQGDLAATGGVPSQAGQNRMEAVAAEILNNAPDLLGLQEDNGTWTTFLSEKLSDYQIITGGEESTIYYRSGMNLVESGFFYLTSTGSNGPSALTVADLTTDGSPYRMSDDLLAMLYITKQSNDSILREAQPKYISKTTGKEVNGSVTYLTCRKMTYGLFDVDGQAILYVNTHLQHRSQGADNYNKGLETLRGLERIKEFEILRGHVEDILKKYPDAKVFITGDYNNVDTGEIYTHVKQFYTDSHSIALTTVGNHTCSWNDAFDLEKQGDNYPDSNEGKGTARIDYCFINNGFFTVTRYKTGAGKATIPLAGGDEKTIYTSDHLPIIIDLNFKVPGGKVERADNGASVYNGIPDTSWYDGSKSEFTLTSAAQFVGMLSLRSSSSGAITFDGKTIRLDCDIILNSGTAEEIASNSGSHFPIPELNSKFVFSGTFDGQGHTVYGLYMQLGTSGIKGPFGTLAGKAVIKNVSFENTFFGTCTTGTGKNIGGALVGKVESNGDVTLSGVSVSGIVRESGQAFNKVGGLVGSVISGGKLTMENCTFAGVMTLPSCNFVGGLIGDVESDTTVTLNNCEVHGTVSGNNYVAGLIGHCVGTLRNNGSVSDATVLAKGSYKNNLVNQ